jgi:hypothetical protein
MTADDDDTAVAGPLDQRKSPLLRLLQCLYERHMRPSSPASSSNGCVDTCEMESCSAADCAAGAGTRSSTGDLEHDQHNALLREVEF